MMVSIQGHRMYLWRAVDSEGEVLDLLVEAKRDTKAAGCVAWIGGPAGAEELGSVGERLPSDLECPPCPSS